MALYWDISKCKDPESLQADHEWSRTSAAITLCMVLGIGNIKDDKDAKEWFLRVKFYEALYGDFFPNNGITLEYVRRFIGLETNVTLERRPGWIKRITTSYFDDRTRAIKDK